MKKRVAIIGTQGVPAAYGGFETLVENLLGANCPDDVEYTVFCSIPECRNPHIRPDRYKGARLHYINIRSHGMSSILYDITSMIRATRGYDVILILGVSGCLFLPIWRLVNRKRLIINIDGIEHRRDKWGSLAKTYLRWSERMAVRYADVVIADNQGIADYVEETYRVRPRLIAYGGDHALRNLSPRFVDTKLAQYGVKRGNYGIAVCRIEPENKCEITLEAFAREGRTPFIFIGNWEHSAYGRDLRARYSRYRNLRIADPEYDLDTLCALRSNAKIYVHGHSAGGTNPSLVEAMFAGVPIACYDVVFNRASTLDRAYYYTTPDDLQALIARTDLDGTPMLEIARNRYTWAHIAAQYTDLY